MTKENEKLRDCLRDAESIITNALRSQPEGDNECKIHLTKAVKDVWCLVYDAKSQMPDGSKYAMEGMGHPSAYDRPSNTAAMREALEFAEDELWAHGLFDASKRIASVLSKPPRNCDRFATGEETLSAFREETGNRKPLELWLKSEIQAFEIWLFALATEQKGCNDGIK